MPVKEATVVTITCDNPSCLGNDLDEHNRLGWTFVSTEVYGQPGEQHVYCSPECAGTITEALNEAKAETQPA
jgi:hypothetical protein